MNILESLGYNAIVPVPPGFEPHPLGTIIIQRLCQSIAGEGYKMTLPSLIKNHPDRHYGRSSLPLTHERAQHTLFLKPDQCMNVIRHDNKTSKASALILQLLFKIMNNNPFRTIIIQQSISTITGKGSEMSISMVVEDSSPHHPVSCTTLFADLLRFAPWQQVATVTPV